MRNIIALVIYNRTDNLKHWLKIWPMCEKPNTELVVIHTGDDSEYRTLCEKSNIKYIKRINRGFDIGVLQDIARKRLADFPEYDNLFFFTDDSYPMRKDFVPYWLSKATFSTGVVCAEVSNIVRPHIRTNAFLISRAALERLKFNVDPITTRQDAWDFEHGTNNIMYNQIKDMGYQVVVPDPIHMSAIWDSGPESKRPDRSEDHYKIFPREFTGKVLVISPIYNRYPALVSALICQSYENWELYLVHDGPNATGLKKLMDAHHDPRIHFVENKERLNQFGHPIRKQYLEKLASGELGKYDYVLISNDDNYYAPSFLRKMVEILGANRNHVAAYCDLLHSYQDYKLMNTKPAYTHIDCGAVLVRANIAAQVGWRDMAHSSDWTYFSDIIQKCGLDKWLKVSGVLFVHN